MHVTFLKRRGDRIMNETKRTYRNASSRFARLAGVVLCAVGVTGAVVALNEASALANGSAAAPGSLEALNDLPKAAFAVTVSSHCGNGVVDDVLEGSVDYFELCDPAAGEADSAHCNATCDGYVSSPYCNDGIVQVDAGEVCDPAQDANCNAACDGWQSALAQ